MKGETGAAKVAAGTESDDEASDVAVVVKPAAGELSLDDAANAEKRAPRRRKRAMPPSGAKAMTGAPPAATAGNDASPTAAAAATATAPEGSSADSGLALTGNGNNAAKDVPQQRAQGHHASKRVAVRADTNSGKGSDAEDDDDDGEGGQDDDDDDEGGHDDDDDDEGGHDDDDNDNDGDNDDDEGEGEGEESDDAGGSAGPDAGAKRAIVKHRNNAGRKRHGDDERRFACHVCDKRFWRKTHLTRHSKAHQGKYEHHCEHCGKAFYRRDQYSVHLRSHTGERPYACAHQGCGKRFTQKGALTRHERIHVP